MIGVLGAGTMGAGIAQLGCQAGEDTVLFDTDAVALERARDRIAAGIEKAAAKGRAQHGDAERLRLAMRARARSSAAGSASSSRVSSPAWQPSCAIPAPIVPAPTTPSVMRRPAPAR